MMRFIMPIILIGIAIAGFFMVTNPLYGDISNLRAQAVSYNEALDNAKALENERDKLTKKYNAIDPNNLIKLEKLLPDNVNNIRLILEIGQIALPYGMVLKDVKYNATQTDSTKENVVQGGAVATSKDYGTFDLEFSTSGTYDNFISFVSVID